MSKFVYGIDLGTTYSCIARVDETGNTEVIKNKEGKPITPSVVFFENPTNIIVGQVAKDTSIIEPEKTVSLVKTLMGKADVARVIDDKIYSPAEVSSYILRKMAKDASEQINQEVKDVVITVPAYFGLIERQATEAAGQMADLNVLGIVDEPVAAAIYYGCTKEQKDTTILVYDLGGGTFDVTVMHIKEGDIEVICKEGDHNLGGRNWDAALVEYMESKFREETGFEGDLENDDYQELQLKAEKMKILLTERDSTKEPLVLQGLRSRIEFTREKFDELTSDLLEKSIKKTDEAIEIAKGKGYPIDKILLVGGSTRMPQVEAALVSKYNLKPQILDPDEAVAKGAAIYAVDVYINGTGPIGPSDVDEKPQKEKEELTIGGTVGENHTKIRFVTNKSYGVKAKVNGSLKLYNLIIKNDKLPFPENVLSITQTFDVEEDNQDNVNIEVYETDDMVKTADIDEYFNIGNAVLPLPPNLKAGSPIEVTFTLYSDGKLHIRGYEPSSNKEIEADMQAKGIVSQEIIEEVRKKSSGITIQ